MECADTLTDLSAADAHLILEPYFAAAKEVFEEAGMRRVAGTRLYVAPWVHDSERHFAACRDDGLAIIVAPELAELPEDTVAAMFCHELGHATDFLYPAEYALGREREAIRRPRADAADEREWGRWARDWERRDDDAVEITADAIAELATGRRIGYLGPCKLQCFDRGAARPEGLR